MSTTTATPPQPSLDLKQRVKFDTRLAEVLKVNPTSKTVRALIRAKYNLTIPATIWKTGNADQILAWLEQQMPEVPVPPAQPEMVKVDVEITDEVTGSTYWRRSDVRAGIIQIPKADFQQWIREADEDEELLFDRIKSYLRLQRRRLPLEIEYGEARNGDDEESDIEYVDQLSINTSLEELIERFKPRL